jgi:hypothetical protein
LRFCTPYLNKLLITPKRLLKISYYTCV